MVTLVVIFNLLLALLNFYVAWRVWRMRRVISGVTHIITVAERNTRGGLQVAPRAIAKGESGTKALRQQYQRLELQLERLGQILALIGLGQQILRRRAPKIKQAKLDKKSRAKYS
jgi:hypothetical protein